MEFIHFAIAQEFHTDPDVVLNVWDEEMVLDAMDYMGAVRAKAKREADRARHARR